MVYLAMPFQLNNSCLIIHFVVYQLPLNVTPCLSHTRQYYTSPYHLHRLWYHGLFSPCFFSGGYSKIHGPRGLGVQNQPRKH